MSYIVTARKWRPQVFKDVVGQEHITTTLKNAIKNGRIGHSYIFAGPRGVGKTTTARILAKSLNCLNPVDAEPCNECEMCKLFNSSQSLDIIEIDGASNRRIEDIRTLRESVKYAPTKGKYKIYIIDEVHMLTTESFNALLKTLEEPPEHTLFIFATTDIHKVPLTIISRCQRYDFRRIELDTIKGLLGKIAKAEGIEIDDDSLTLIGKKADGALRDAESLFDQVISFSGNKVTKDIISKMLNLVDEDIYFTLTDSILERNFNAPFEITKTIYNNGWNYVDFYNGLIEHFRNILAVVVRGKTDLLESSEISKAKYLSYKDKFKEPDLLRMLEFVNRKLYEIKNASNQKITLEISLAQLVGFVNSTKISEIIKTIENSADSLQKTGSEEKKKSEQNIATKSFSSSQIDTSQETNEKVDLLPSWDEFILYLKENKPFFIPYDNIHFDFATKNEIFINISDKNDLEIINNKIENFKQLVDSFYKNHFKLVLSFKEIKINKNSDEIPQNQPLNTTSSKNNYTFVETELGKKIEEILGGKRL